MTVFAQGENRFPAPRPACPPVRLPASYAGKSLRQLLSSDPRPTRTLAHEVRGWLAGIRYYLSQPRQAPPGVATTDARPISAP